MRRQGGGSIVNVGSIDSLLGMNGISAYAASKWGLRGLTKSAALELGRDGIRVNCVAPGFTMSDGVKEHPEVVEQLRDVSVAARTIQRDQVPEDVVGAVTYLASPAASFVTGQTIVIDGGQYFH
jgi:NAD(P)-dependent dehydrogenase (short-subunit alcohol dehydrogenase family)